MNRNKAALVVTVAGIAVSAMLSGCGGVSSAPPPVPAEETSKYSDAEFTNAENVQSTNIWDYADSRTDVIIFDIERDGETLTCSTKKSPDSGVSCFVKSPR